MRHGTSYAYRTLRCRCDDCRAAERVVHKRARDIARERGYDWYQHELAAARERKERYRGICENCGGPTTGCFGPGLAPRLCVTCTNAAKEPAHGTYSRYTSSKWRCRCDLCRAANAAYQRGYRRLAAG